jgi:hypothetical protein
VSVPCLLPIWNVLRRRIHQTGAKPLAVNDDTGIHPIDQVLLLSAAPLPENLRSRATRGPKIKAHDIAPRGTSGPRFAVAQSGVSTLSLFWGSAHRAEPLYVGA